MYKYLLDTNIISEAVKREPSQLVITRLDMYQAECVIGAPTWQELLLGLYRMQESPRRTIIESYYRDIVRSNIDVISYDQSAAEWHAHELSRLLSIGKPVPLLDSQLAAIAATRGLTIVTRNTKDFQNYQGISIENWFEQS